MLIETVEAQMRQGGGKNTRTSTDRVKLKSDGPTYWAVTTTSFRLWLVATSGHPIRMPYTCSPDFRNKPLTSYTVLQPQQHTKISSWFSRAITKTTSWKLPTSLTSRPESG
jgi:hypothetical protein